MKHTSTTLSVKNLVSGHHNTATEKWISIKGYKGFYEVSDQGRVRGLERRFHTKQGWTRRSARLIKPWPEKEDYLAVYLCKAGKKNKFKVHRLVAGAFFPNPKRLPIVNHKNREVQDNRAENLEWVTAKRSIQHAVENGAQLGVRGAKNKSAKLNEQRVRAILELSLLPGFFISTMAIAANVGSSTVHSIVHGKKWKHVWAEFIKGRLKAKRKRQTFKPNWS